SDGWRAVGGYFALLTGLAWMAMMLLVAMLGSRLEPLYAAPLFKGGVPVMVAATSALSHVLHIVGLPLAAGILVGMAYLALACGRAKSRRVVIATILSGAASMVLFLVFAVAIFVLLYTPFFQICSHAAIRH
ncbi:MAG: hypothetical protein NT049_15050, partial [Planctomycetota bacterium]|nr:hypothetical protein [Planctomycetota bacterium]